MKNIKTLVTERYQGERVLIWGAGREGLSTFRFLRKYLPDQHLWVADPGELDKDLFTNCTHLKTGNWTGDFNTCRFIFKSPGIPILDSNIDRSKLTSQTQLFLECCRRQTIGITGTKGKSTTASLLYHILKGTRGDTLLVGNIGIPCLDYLEQVRNDSLVVFEMSCHQLESVSLSPHISVLLNLYEDHLDHYGTYEKYVQAKENIFRFQHSGDTVILNAKDAAQITRAINPVLAAMDGTADIHLEADGNVLSIPGSALRLAPADTSLPGKHNRYNIAVVYYICHSLGLSDEEFLRELATFRGLPHRLQYVGTVNGVSYYDDSISTICETTIQALHCLPNTGTLLLGGMDRGIDYIPLAKHLAQCPSLDTILLMPDTHARLLSLLREHRCPQEIRVVSNLEEAVREAKNCTAQGKACLLSPAAASYGYFKNFEERGDRFQEFVLQNEPMH